MIVLMLSLDIIVEAPLIEKENFKSFKISWVVPSNPNTEETLFPWNGMQSKDLFFSLFLLGEAIFKRFQVKVKAVNFGRYIMFIQVMMVNIIPVKQ
ncbi:hypothetical protein ARAF_0816 [Arsenophonus endosymbiont of Aleurodicus floccissimus]|nr:hypothetical protein ARAF_0816 [Arsenophonus endosymbiont of Aleurodicus floccissimus]